MATGLLPPASGCAIRRPPRLVPSCRERAARSAQPRVIRATELAARLWLARAPYAGN